MKNLHTIEIKHLGATNTKGSRVKLTSFRFDNSVTIEHDYSVTGIYNMAKTWLENNGFKCEYISEGKDCYLIHSSTFEPLKK